jgi:hypothetical protein
MKMAKSHTRKKSAKPIPAEIAVQLDSVTDYIKQWTDRELEKIKTSNDTPVCIPVKGGYRLGNYRIQISPNKTSELYNQNRELVHTFDNKISAVLYTIYTIKMKYNTADEIMFWDKEINKNYTDSLNLKRTIDRARKSQDYESVDIRTARLEIAQANLDFARDKLSALHSHAKFNKVWE